MNRSDEVRVHIERLLQLHAIRVRELRDEEIAINARTELLRRLTERLLRGDLDPTTAKNSDEAEKTVNHSSGHDYVASELPSGPVAPTMVFSQRGKGIEEAICDNTNASKELVHTAEPTQSHANGPSSVSGSQRHSGVRSTVMRSNSPDAKNTTGEMNDAKADKKKREGRAVASATPSPERRELDAFFPMADAKHKHRNRKASATAQAERYHFKETLSDQGNDGPAVQQAVTPTDIIAGIPGINTTANIQEGETKSYVRTVRRRQREYAEEEAMHRTRDGRPCSRSENMSLTPSSYWEIQFPHASQN